MTKEFRNIFKRAAKRHDENARDVALLDEMCRGKFIRVPGSRNEVYKIVRVYYCYGRSFSARGLLLTKTGALGKNEHKISVHADTEFIDMPEADPDEKLLIENGFGPRTYWGRTGQIKGVGHVSRETILEDLKKRKRGAA